MAAAPRRAGGGTLTAALPSKAAKVALLGLVGAVVALWPVASIADAHVLRSVTLSALVSVAGFFATRSIIPLVARRTHRAGLWGKDINKKGTKEGEKEVPEALGLAPGVAFLVCVVAFQQLHHSGAAGDAASDAWLVDYNAALATICFMLFLGFADDVLDIPWRVKLLLPTVASLPLVVAYGGGTGVAVPKPLHGLLGLPAYLELGVLYKAYMVLLTIFCANAINIFAGVNGLEAGQTFVIACAVACHNLTTIAAGAAAATVDGHLFSLYLMLPLAATTLALLWHNWFPSSVFVGDTFTYFAGMALAVAGILGHFSETLLIFLIPQVFNFAYSLPQLFKLVPCPRHRLPTFDPATRLLTATPNWNLVNLWLRFRGPLTEERLCTELLVLQAGCCGAGFAARYLLAGVYK